MNGILNLNLHEIRNMDSRYRAHLINSLSGFKSANLVGTTDGKANNNLSVVSSAFHLGANPALMGFIMRPITVTRDTYNNILSIGDYTFNHLTSEIYLQAHQCSARYPEEVSEFDEVGLTPLFSGQVQAPYVSESPVRIGLKFREKIDIQLNGTVLIIGEIVEIFVPAQQVAEDGYLDLEAAGSIACSGLDTYHSTQKLARLSYAKPGKVPEVLK